MQSEHIRIAERNRRETEKILRNIEEYETEIQEEMFKEFDQSTFDLGLQGFHNALFLTNENLSDSFQLDSDHNMYLSHAVTSTSSPTSHTKLNNISKRIKTPIRMKSIMRKNIQLCDGSF